MQIRVQQILARVGPLIALSLPLTAGTILQYTFPGSVFSPTTVASYVSATDVNSTGSSASLQPGFSYPNSIFLANPDGLAPDAAAAVAQDRFFQFTVSPLKGGILNLTDLSFDAGRGGPSTPRGYVVRSSLDGFGSDLGMGLVTTQQPDLLTYTTQLHDVFASVTGPVTFRVYGFSPSGAGIFFDNLTLEGALYSPVLASYEFPNSTFAPTTSAAFVTANTINALGSGADLQPGAALPNSMFLEIESGSAQDPAGAVAEQQYFQFSLASEPGYWLTATSLEFDVGRGGPSTPRGYVMRSSLDGYASDLGSGEVTTIQPLLLHHSVSLDASFQNVPSVNFRIYGYSPNAATGLFFDNIEVLGTASRTPEPATGVLVAGMLVIGWAARRRLS